MFRRLADRVNNAVSGSSSSSAKVEMLKTMGFDAVQAQQALQATNGDVDRAAELLLASNTPSNNTATTSTRTTAPRATTTADQALQNAMQASLQDEEERRVWEAQQASLDTARPPRSAAAIRAGQAAARRHEPSKKAPNTQKRTPPKQQQQVIDLTTTTTTRTTSATATANLTIDQGHNLASRGIKVPAKLQDKTKEEQVLRNTDRLKSHPAAVDTLYKALKRLQANPTNDKFRKIDTATPGYKRCLEGVPGAEALLLTMNFHKRGTMLILEAHLVDPALLYLGISALEGAKESPEYQTAKRKLDFDKVVKEIRQDASPEEAARRAACLRLVPSESTGRGALINVVIGDETIRRKFDGDDQLRDVVNWIGGHGSVLVDKISSRDWCLVDLNHFPVAPIDCDKNIDSTLQYLGFWPSGRFEVRPSTDEWRIDGREAATEKIGSSRGLGAAPTEALRY